VDTSALGSISGFTTGGTTIQINPIPAQVLCSAAGISTSVTTWTTLGACDIPASGLNAGDRIEVRFTFAHSGTTTGFNLRLNWGNTTILARTGAAQDVAVAGEADAAVTSTGAQVSVQSWGTVLPFLPGILNAPLQAGLQVNLRAALAAVGPDSVTLTNYTVLRYPNH
jgi:hypothetical protein